MKRPPVLEIDGSRFNDLAGFAEEFSAFLTDTSWGGNLDAFNDILSGGFGTPAGGFTLRWKHADISRQRLGHGAMAAWLGDVLETCHASNRQAVLDEIAAARRGDGPTLFDMLVDIICDHGPGGSRPGDGVHLELR